MKRIFKIVNPETNRWIKVGGPTYQDLLTRGLITGKEKKRVAKSFSPPSNYEVPTSFKDYPITSEKWALSKPQKISERRKVLDECGESCFLIPSDLKFPICNKNPPPCKYNVNGLKAASSRAGEWKYDKVLATSKYLTEKVGGYKKRTN